LLIHNADSREQQRKKLPRTRKKGRKKFKETYNLIITHESEIILVEIKLDEGHAFAMPHLVVFLEMISNTKLDFHNFFLLLLILLGVDVVVNNRFCDHILLLSMTHNSIF